MITAKTMNHGRTLEPAPPEFLNNLPTPPTSDTVNIYTLHEYTVTFTGSHYRPDLSLPVLADYVRRLNRHLTPLRHAIQSTARGLIYPDPFAEPIPYQAVTATLLYDTRHLPANASRYLEAQIRGQILTRLADFIAYGMPYGME